ncbi:uncharacterized protein SPSK_02010 [Sporothrix schenckii 1099-18]|uniref:Uncharacterized protein n=1 Tax=Sporothrix schenckii 1099-18 TaxID=1397361 RepID=A0A0F2MEK4_SPOSC|nr:uncharacterized protein SPSK_02010 [Sporothrix schenckii 1099-18]KJR87290.1 hypothetical protein SPSK_02010 [Sporothrix schenckii 1099-18]
MVRLSLNIPHRDAIMVLSSLSCFWVLPLSTRLRLGRTYFKSLTPNVVRVSRHRIIKGPYDPRELEALLYVRKHTTILVPRVYRVYHASNGRIYIETGACGGRQPGRAVAQDAPSTRRQDDDHGRPTRRGCLAPQPPSASTTVHCGMGIYKGGLVGWPHWTGDLWAL